MGPVIAVVCEHFVMCWLLYVRQVHARLIDHQRVLIINSFENGKVSWDFLFTSKLQGSCFKTNTGSQISVEYQENFLTVEQYSNEINYLEMW